MRSTRIMKRFCKQKQKEVILLEEKIKIGEESLPGKEQWKVLLCRDINEDCQKLNCEHINHFDRNIHLNLP
ncbi:MAG: hypothetical protein AB1650_08585 [Candidatus Omnitrophota bacterium]